jgi:hypothetical protein
MSWTPTEIYSIVCKGLLGRLNAVVLFDVRESAITVEVRVESKPPPYGRGGVNPTRSKFERKNS